MLQNAHLLNEDYIDATKYTIVNEDYFDATQYTFVKRGGLY